MGVDIHGRGNPSAEFHATWWTWRPILSVIEETCADLIDADVIQSMGFNDGAGPDRGDTCSAIADRIEAYCSTIGAVVLPCDEIRVDPATNTVIRDHKLGEGESPYSATPERIGEFVAFLRECDGFKVY